jgi:heme-degrading monooxygenase HmoA
VRKRSATVQVGSAHRWPASPASRRSTTVGSPSSEAVSISLFEDRESADAAAITMNAQPLLDGQVNEMLPTPDAVTFYEVVTSLVRDEVPTAGRLGYVTLALGQVGYGAARWVTEAFAPMLERQPGLCQAYFLRAPDGAQQIALTFWASPEAMAAGGAAVGSWQARETAAGRSPAFTGTEASVLTALQVAIAGVPSTMPVVV